MANARPTPRGTPHATSKIDLDESQERALAMILTEPVCVITGGPGTGKTTILREAIARMRGEDVALCAPTGKAAKRMSEATGTEARTIHRLLQWSPSEGSFWYGESQKLPHDVVIIDEASMVDTELLANLCSALDTRRTRLVLVGDANQLPSVGPGAILADLVECKAIPAARLTRVHRSAAESWVCANAPRILSGEPLSLAPRGDFRFAEVNDAGNVIKFCGDEMKGNPHIQFLVPQRTGSAGADALNAALQERFNPLRPDETEWKGKGRTLRVGDRVIHTENNYELGVFNGEVGDVVGVNDKALQVKFPDRSFPVEYSRAEAAALHLAYALTIHKSQGSEWPWVGVVVHSTHSFMLTRQLIYTAVTRAREGVVIIGNAKGMETALKSKRGDSRNTALADRIEGRL